MDTDTDMGHGNETREWTWAQDTEMHTDKGTGHKHRTLSGPLGTWQGKQSLQVWAQGEAQHGVDGRAGRAGKEEGELCQGRERPCWRNEHQQQGRETGAWPQAGLSFGRSEGVRGLEAPALAAALPSVQN